MNILEHAAQHEPRHTTVWPSFRIEIEPDWTNESIIMNILEHAIPLIWD